jgi:hypothetical protein
MSPMINPMQLVAKQTKQLKELNATLESVRAENTELKYDQKVKEKEVRVYYYWWR